MLNKKRNQKLKRIKKNMSGQVEINSNLAFRIKASRILARSIFLFFIKLMRLFVGLGRIVELVCWSGTAHQLINGRAVPDQHTNSTMRPNPTNGLSSLLKTKNINLAKILEAFILKAKFDPFKYNH